MKIDQSVLLEILETLKGTAAVNPNIDIFSTVCFRDDLAITYDGITGTIVRFDSPFNTCVEHATLYKLVKCLSGELELTLTDQNLVVKSQEDGFTAKIKAQDTRDFPDILPKSPSTLCQATNLQEGLKYLAKSMTKRGELNFMGVGIRKDLAYSSTGKNLTRFRLDQPSDVSCHLPPSFVTQLVKIGQPVRLFRDGANIGAQWEQSGLKLVCRQVAAKFPFDQIDHCFNKEEAIYQLPASFHDAVERVMILAGEDDAVKISTDGQGVVNISARSAEGDVVQKVDLAIPPFEIHISGKRFRKAAASHAQVDFGDVLRGEGRALRFVTADGKGEQLIALQYGD